MVLKENQKQSNWLHIYERSSLLPNTKSAVDVIKRFNESHKGDQVHTTIHSFISIKLVLSVIKDWVKLVKLEKLIKKSLKSLKSIKSLISLKIHMY